MLQPRRCEQHQRAEEASGDAHAERRYLLERDPVGRPGHAPGDAQRHQHEPGSGVGLGLRRVGHARAFPGGLKGSREGCGPASVAPLPAARARVLVPETGGQTGPFVMLHRSDRCVSKPRDFRGVQRDAPASSPEIEVPLEFQGLGAHRPRRCRACGIARKKTRRGRRKRNRFRHGGPLRDRPVRACAREKMRIDAVKGRSRPVRRAGRRERRSRPPRAQPGVHRRGAGARRSPPCSTRPASAGSRPSSCKVVASNRRLFAVRDMIRAFRTLVARHKGEVTAEVTLRREAERGASRRDQGRAQGGDQEGRAGRREGRSRDHRRARGQARLPHGRHARSAPSSMRSSTR